MKLRLLSEFGTRRTVNAMHIGTFHSICLRLLSEHGQVAMADEAESLFLAEEVLREFGLKGSAGKFLQSVSDWKNRGSVAESSEYPLEALETYSLRLKEYGVLDCDDLLLEALKLPKVTFPYLLVDEFQDSNDLQYQLIRSWSREGKSLFVIGDPDQSIYEFRGSDPLCFQRLEKEFPGLETIRLVTNYRSTPEIINCATSFLSRDGTPRSLSPNRSSGVP